MPESRQITVEIQNVKKDDVFSTDNLSNVPYGARVHGVDAKVKWVIVNDENGHTLARLERNTMVQVLREFKTDAEKRVEKRTSAEWTLRRNYERGADTLQTVLSDALAKGEVSHWMLDKIVEAEAYRKVRDLLTVYIERAEAVGCDIVHAACALAMRYIEEDKYNRSPLSRSTSITSNLEEDMTEWAKGKFVEGMRWAGLNRKDMMEEIAYFTNAVDVAKAENA